MSWTQEQDAAIVELWERGETASYIAKRIDGKSRNAVLGRLDRLRRAGANIANRARAASVPRPPRQPRVLAAPRGRPAIRLAGPLRRPQRVLERLPPPPVVVVKTGEVEPNGTPASLMELCAAACRWSVSSSSPHLFCNKIRRGGSPYCDEHTLKSFAPKKLEAAE